MKITLDNLSKKYNREWIFKGLGYKLNQGKSYSITGPNGSGKSTLLKIISGASPATSGTIQYQQNDQEISGDDIYQYMSLATPYMELVEEFTLIEMLKFHFGFKSTSEQHTIDDLINIMYLEKAKSKQIKNFSSGMKQRLKLGLAFFSDTPILMLDEPTSNLDTKGTDWYLKHVHKLKTEKLLVIASNQHYEYDFCQHEIELGKLHFT